MDGIQLLMLNFRGELEPSGANLDNDGNGASSPGLQGHGVNSGRQMGHERSAFLRAQEMATMPD
jgi:hypothetical protein